MIVDIDRGGSQHDSCRNYLFVPYQAQIRWLIAVKRSEVVKDRSTIRTFYACDWSTAVRAIKFVSHRFSFPGRPQPSLLLVVVLL